MKNKIILALLMIILTTQVMGSSEIKAFETDIEIRITEGFCEIITEEANYNYACTGTSTNQIDIDFFRNVTCGDDHIEDLLSQNQALIRTLSEGINDTNQYYNKYLECYASEKLCQEKVDPGSTDNAINYEVKYNEAFENYNNCKSEKSSLVTARQNSDSQLSTCEKERQAAEDAKLMWGVVGAIIGGAAGYMFWGKKKSPAVSAAEAQLPKSR